MTAIIFDGRAFAKTKEEELTLRVQKLLEDGVTPKMVSLVIGDIDGSLKYQEMKKKAGERIGITIEVLDFGEETEKTKVIETIEKLNTDTSVHGIMVQLPLPKKFTNSDREQIINAIVSTKDVDGMREDSEYVAPVVRAVLAALNAANQLSVISYQSPRNDISIAVLGAKGFEGEKIVKEIGNSGYVATALDKGDDLGRLLDMDVVISATGNPNLITGDMVKEGVIVIDVGAPRGDFDFESVSQRASFITPVPGGIGPMTIALLMENIVKAASK